MSFDTKVVEFFSKDMDNKFVIGFSVILQCDFEKPMQKRVETRKEEC